MNTNLIRLLSGKVRSKKGDMILGLILAFVAGAINAGGFLVVGQYTSHMTGILSSVADFIALNKFSSAIITFSFLISFIFGALVSTILINWARYRNLSSEYAIALLLESFLLLLFGLFAHFMPTNSGLAVNVVVILLCFIMGLQNAIITKISNTAIRTTHITGIATDIGISLGRHLYFIRENSHKKSENYITLKFRSLLLFTFLAGGIIGALSFKSFGFIVIIPISIFLFAISSIPVFDDIKSKFI